MSSAWGDTTSVGASWITVADAILEGAVIEVRDGVGIDRRTGAGATGIKYSREVIAAGATLRLRLRADIPSAQKLAAAVHAEVAAIVGFLRDEGLAVGAATTRGLGKLKVEGEILVRQVDLASRAGMLAYLDGRSPQHRLAPGQPVGDSLFGVKVGDTQGPLVRLTLRLRARGPILVGAGVDGLAVDTLPLVSRSDTAVRVLLPGSSVKGTLRSRAERIARAVRTAEPSTVTTPRDFLDQIQDSEVVTRLFGEAAERQKSERDGGQMKGRRGALAVEDATLLEVPKDTWDAVMTTSRDDLGRALGPVPHDKVSLDAAMHVAIDRWTGGAAEGLLYSVLEPWPLEPFDVVLRLDLRLLGNDDIARAAVFLLLLVLRDVERGLVPFGRGTLRGCGTVEVEGVRVDSRGLPDWLHWLQGKNELRCIGDLSEDDVAPLQEAWSRWIISALPRSVEAPS